VTEGDTPPAPEGAIAGLPEDVADATDGATVALGPGVARGAVDEQAATVRATVVTALVTANVGRKAGDLTHR
jgi:hypothetical protein